jgi:hypothetical protein
MRFYLRLEERAGSRGGLTTHAEDIQSAIRDTRLGWVSQSGDGKDALVDQMAQRLPASDVHRFLATVRYGLRSRTEFAGLTISEFDEEVADAKVVRNFVIRMFISSTESEARLPALGARVASVLVELFPTLTVAEMVIWQHAELLPVLVGSETPTPSRRTILLDNLALSVIALVSGCLLVLLFGASLVEYWDWNWQWARARMLGDDLAEWFKRLVGPLGSAFATSAVGLYVLFRRSRVRRVAWSIHDRG